MRTLVIADNDLFARWVTVCLASAGHHVLVMAPGAHRLTRLSRHCRAHTAGPGQALLRQPDASLLERIDRYCREHTLEAAVPADLPAALLLARGRDRLTIPTLFPVSDAALIERFHDKWEFNGLLRTLGLPTPRTWLWNGIADVERGAWDFPLMLKPPRGEGGVGVRRVDSRSALSNVLGPYGEQHGWPILAQEFIPGRDIDLSVLADRGRIVAWTVQQSPTGQPGDLEFLQHPRVLEIGAALVRATGYHGIAHFDLRIDDRTGQPLFLEANPRFWGSLRHSLWSGVNFPALGLALARGQDAGIHFRPVVGPCRDPGFSIRSSVHALLQGRLRPDRWSSATEAGWRCHLSDPIPEIWQRLRLLGEGRKKQEALRT
ncbi:MAG TPA: ATP-grasp domain-containing protein [Planctomycetota bacterium]|nr:ATP-grasp domain-containing protein [Planctomycetota bacterium]